MLDFEERRASIFFIASERKHIPRSSPVFPSQGRTLLEAELADEVDEEDADETDEDTSELLLEEELLLSSAKAGAAEAKRDKLTIIDAVFFIEKGK